MQSVHCFSEAEAAPLDEQLDLAPQWRRRAYLVFVSAPSFASTSRPAITTLTADRGAGGGVRSWCNGDPLTRGFTRVVVTDAMRRWDSAHPPACNHRSELMTSWILAHGNGLDELAVLASGMALALAVRLLVAHRRTPRRPRGADQ